MCNFVKYYSIILFKIHTMEEIVKNTINLQDVHYDKNGEIIFGKGCLKEPVVCVRPGHKTGQTQIYAEEKFGKIISHNYGHAGVGYSILFGSVEKAIENFQKIRLENGVKYEDEITIIGLGCVGLVTALTLYFRGFKNIKLVGEKFLGTPSFGAGGLIDFSLSTIYKPEQINIMNELFKFTFQEYQEIAKGKHKFIKYGVREVDYLTDFFQDNAGLNYLSNIGMIPKMKKVKVKFGEKNPTVRELYHFKTYHVVTHTFMTSLLYTIEKLKIPIDYRKLSSFNDIKSGVIFNCSGLGSRELNNDLNMYPICGHGFTLQDEKLGNMDYIMRITEVPELKGSLINGSIYFMPKTSGFVGGTYIKNYDGSDENMNKEYIKQIFARSKLIFEGKNPIPKF
jgi:D-amino-acid oxidase